MKLLFICIFAISRLLADSQDKSSDLILPIQTIEAAHGPLKYSATRGFVPVTDGDRKEKSKIHYIGYFAEPKNTSRPIFFCFNGGPGSSSVWLHMGLLGPYIVDTQSSTKPPHQLSINTQTPLSYADLIFIDPVSTGFSETNHIEADKKFLGVQEDISSCAQCIQALLSRFNRWNSPIYIVGESYGGLRAIGVAANLKNRCMIDVQGLFMISPAIDLQTIADNSILSQICAFPTYALLAQYYKKCSSENGLKSKEQLYVDARLFAQTTLLPCLIQGDSSSQSNLLSAAKKMEEFTGIKSKDLVENFLQLTAEKFQLQLLKDEGLELGSFDGRITTPGALSGNKSTFDPGLDLIASPFTETAMQYLRDKLGWNGTGSYTILKREHGWDWKDKDTEPGFGYLSYTDQLRTLMIRCPNLKVFVASGFYDLATPAYSQEYAIDQLLLKSNKRTTIKKFASGHMIYLSPENRSSLLESLQQFVCGK